MQPSETKQTPELVNQDIAPGDASVLFQEDTPPVQPPAKQHLLQKLGKKRIILIGILFFALTILGGTVFALVVKQNAANPDDSKRAETSSATNDSDNKNDGSTDDPLDEPDSTETDSSPDNTTNTAPTSSSSTNTMSTAPSTSTGSTTTAPPPSGGGSSNPTPPPPVPLTIDIYDGSFSQPNFSLKAGTTYSITITNRGTQEVHTLTSALFDTGRLAPGQSKTVSIKPTSTGTFKFSCNNPCAPYHNSMQVGYTFTVS